LPPSLTKEFEFLDQCVSGAKGLPRGHLETVGGRLFDALFSGAVRDEFYWHMGCAEAESRSRGEERPLRILLQLQGDKLGNVPWELLFDRSREEFLALSRRATLTRSVGTEGPFPQLLALPIRVGFLVNAPRDQSRFGFAHFSTDELLDEVKVIRRALGRLEKEGAVICEKPMSGGIPEFQERMMPGKDPLHVLHVIGHGCFRGGQGRLLFSDSKGSGCLKEAAWFRTQIRQESMRLVFLNCCRTGVFGPGNLSGLASSLVRSGTPAVIAMGLDVPDEFAKRFAQGLYSLLAQPGAPWIDVCVRGARLAAIQGDPSRSADWTAPSLFAQLSDRPLFELDPAEGLPVHPASFAPAPAHVRGFDGRQGSFERAQFAGRQLNGSDFANADLSGASFEGAALQYANFTDALLPKADLRYADLRGADFTRATIANADIRRALIKGLKLYGAKCSYMKFNSARELITQTVGWESALWDADSLNRIHAAQVPA